jgi:hypothetical protein
MVGTFLFMKWYTKTRLTNDIVRIARIRSLETRGNGKSDTFFRLLSVVTADTSNSYKDPGKSMHNNSNI